MGVLISLMPELAAVVDKRMHYHNTERWHSSLAYRSPMQFIQQTTIMVTPEVHT